MPVDPSAERCYGFTTLDRTPTMGWLLGTILIGLAAPACRGGMQGNEDAVPGLRLEGVTFRFFRGDVLHSFGQAARADYRRETDDLLAREIRAVLPRHGENVRVTATEGQGHLRGRDFFAKGGVTARRSDVLAVTSTARYVGGPPEVIDGPNAVRVTGPAWELTGTGFTLDPETEDLAVGSGGGVTRLISSASRTQ